MRSMFSRKATQMNKQEWWYPSITNAAWCQETRDERHKKEDQSADDEEIRDEYADGQKYWTGWDHCGDAYAQFEPLADSWLEQQARIEGLEAALKECISEIELRDKAPGLSLIGAEKQYALKMARAALKKGENPDES